MNFQISLDSLQHGWATLTFTDQSADYSIAFSYVPIDTLNDLIQGAIRLFDNRSSEIKFYLDPGEVTLNLKPDGDSEFSVEIDKYHFHGTKARFARQVLKMFDSYVFQYSYESYENNWGHPFPHRSLSSLRECLQQK